MRNRIILLVAFFATLLLTGAACGFGQSTPPDGGIYVTTDRGETFQQRNFVAQDGDNLITLNLVDIADIIFHPVDHDIIYATSFSNGIYKSTNGGQQWSKIGLTTGAYTRLVIDPITPSTLYASDGRTVVKSVDAGESWSQVYIETRGDQSITDLTLDPRESARVIATTNTGGILLSEDFGGTWDVQQFISRGIAQIVFHPRDSKIFYLLTTDQHLLRTRDGGERFTDLNVNWKAISENLGELHTLTFRESAPEVLYLATQYGLLKSVDSGDTWVLMNTLVRANTVPITHIGLHPTDPLVLYFTAGNTLHRSLDDGEVWAVRSIPTSRSITSLVFHPDLPGMIFMGTRLNQ